MKVRPFYTYYVAHIISQYFFADPPVNPTPAYKANAEAVKKVISAMPKHLVSILREVYQSSEGGPSLSVRVSLAAEKYNMDRTSVWELISSTEKRVAQARQLI